MQKLLTRFTPSPIESLNNYEILIMRMYGSQIDAKSKVTFTKCGIFCGIFFIIKTTTLCYQGTQRTLYFLPFRPNIVVKQKSQPLISMVGFFYAHYSS